MGLPTALVLAAGAIKATSEVVSGMYEAQAMDAQTQEYKINAKQSRYAAEQAYQEGAMSVNQATLSARQEIGSGIASMSASGNIGTSAQAAIVQSYMNLGKDVSAINYKYGNEARLHKNKAAMLEYNADISEINRKNRITSSWLKAGAEVAKSIGSAAFMGGFSGTPKVTGFTDAVTNDGMYGAWGGF
ncbi:MAG: hypothetical protein J6R22_02940 [Alphaproteobacteria bacterium]|nr:hypothetical protein [Alphaproteobacteria bacterium]